MPRELKCTDANKLISAINTFNQNPSLEHEFFEFCQRDLILQSSSFCKNIDSIVAETSANLAFWINSKDFSNFIDVISSPTANLDFLQYFDVNLSKIKTITVHKLAILLLEQGDAINIDVIQANLLAINQLKQNTKHRIRKEIIAGTLCKYYKQKLRKHVNAFIKYAQHQFPGVDEKAFQERLASVKPHQFIVMSDAIENRIYVQDPQGITQNTIEHQNKTETKNWRVKISTRKESAANRKTKKALQTSICENSSNAKPFKESENAFEAHSTTKLNETPLLLQNGNDSHLEVKEITLENNAEKFPKLIERYEEKNSEILTSENDIGTENKAQNESVESEKMRGKLNAKGNRKESKPESKKEKIRSKKASKPPNSAMKGESIKESLNVPIETSETWKSEASDASLDTESETLQSKFISPNKKSGSKSNINLMLQKLISNLESKEQKGPLKPVSAEDLNLIYKETIYNSKSLGKENTSLPTGKKSRRRECGGLSSDGNSPQITAVAYHDKNLDEHEEIGKEKGHKRMVN